LLLRTQALVIILLWSPTFTFRWCFSSQGLIPLFPLRPPSFLSKFNLRASKVVCSCFKSLGPLSLCFNLFKEHYFFICFSFSIFIFAMLIFFDGILAKSNFEFFLNTC
jgi:hypothetical protein